MTCRGSCTRFETESEKSMDRGSDATSQCRRPLLFPLTCQYRRNISRRVEVYGLRTQCGSMTQMTTIVSAGIPARMQKSMDLGSDTAPQCRQPPLFLLASSKDATRHEGQISIDHRTIRTCHDQRAVGIEVGSEPDFRTACLPLS